MIIFFLTPVRQGHSYFNFFGIAPKKLQKRSSHHQISPFIFYRLVIVVIFLYFSNPYLAQGSDLSLCVYYNHEFGDSSKVMMTLENLVLFNYPFIGKQTSISI